MRLMVGGEQVKHTVHVQPYLTQVNDDEWTSAAPYLEQLSEDVSQRR